MKSTHPDRSDEALGMGAKITRRDFLDGVLIGAGAMLTRPAFATAAGAAADPPSLTGLRGSHVGSFERAHALAIGLARLDDAPRVDDDYDLVVVGGGLSGLAAAFFYRQAHAAARVLVLDTHDDFGGHAKRNELDAGGRRLIGYGGSQSIDGPAGYSRASKKLLVDLGIDVQRFYAAFDQGFYRELGLDAGLFFDRETFGRDAVVVGDRLGAWFDEGPSSGSRPDAAWLDGFPLPETAKRDLLRLSTETFDPFPGVRPQVKVERLRRMSYLTYLRDVVKVSPAVESVFLRRSNTFWGIGFDALSALEAWRLGQPGFAGAGIDATLVDDRYEDDEPYIFHFPDGNAGIARLLVKRLIPDVASGGTMDEIVTTPFDYTALDRTNAPVRIRLSSTAMRVLPRENGVDVCYLAPAAAQKVHARHCILACYHPMIPFLLPELPDVQKAALREGVRAPLVYTNVALRNWRSFAAARVHRVYCPGAHYQDVALDFPVSLGGYRFSASPDEPIVVHMARAPVPNDGTHPKDQFRAGRNELLGLSFEVMERETRRQLAALLSPYGFDPARDILGITVNRWPHGYAYDRVELFDARSPPGRAPHEIARATLGAVAIAGSDAEGRAYVDAAIDAARRAVTEVLGKV